MNYFKLLIEKHLLVAAMILAIIIICFLPTNVQKVQATTNVEGPRVSNNVTRWDSVYFGHYPQSSNGSGGYNTDPIKWKVIKINGNTMTLVSEYKLDLQKYHTSRTAVTWNNSYLKQWLNSTFLNTAFSSGEQQSIFNDVNGKVQVLTKNEISDGNYGFINTISRAAKNTDYTIAKTQKLGGVGSDVINNGKGIYYGAYWLRETSSSKGLGAVYRGGTAGYVDTGTYYVDNTVIDVLPMIHIKADSSYWSPAGKIMSNGATAPAVPTGVKASRVNYNSAKISWNRVGEADGYQIYKYNNKKYVTISSVNSTSWTDKNLSLNKKYTYKVRAYWNVGNTKKYGGYTSTVSVKIPALSTPTGLNLTKRKGGGITAKWKSVTGASGYRIYYQCSYKKKGKSYKKSKTENTKNKSLKIKLNVSKGTKIKNYKVKVRAYRTINTKKVYGKWSKYKTIKF